MSITSFLNNMKLIYRLSNLDYVFVAALNIINLTMN